MYKLYRFFKIPFGILAPNEQIATNGWTQMGERKSNRGDDIRRTFRPKAGYRAKLTMQVSYCVVDVVLDFDLSAMRFLYRYAIWLKARFQMISPKLPKFAPQRIKSTGKFQN